MTEDNSFGTHEFFELCEQIGCKTYINGNVGSGTVQEMSEWVEYMTFDGVSPMADLRRKNGREKAWKVDYFGVGNENWGCGGNMTPSYRVLPDGTVRPVFLYTVDADEFVVNKLLDRGSLAATTIVTNVQDFIMIVVKGLGLM